MRFEREVPPPRIRARVRAIVDQFLVERGLEPPEREPLEDSLDDRVPWDADEYDRRYP